MAVRVKSSVVRRRLPLFTSDVIAALLIALAPLLYFLPATLGRLVLAPDDALIFGLPLRVTAAQMIRDGHLPLWNPYIFCGMPLFASAQGGMLFPLNWALIFSGVRGAMNFAVLASYAAAGVGAFFYARRSGANLLGAIVTALVWQLGGVSIGQIGHTNILHVFAVLPWLCWSIDGYVIARTPKRAALIALFVALQVFAGHQQTLAYALLLAGAYAIATVENKRAALFSLGCIGFGLLLAAIQLLPTAELLRHSLRNQSSYEFFSSFSMPPVCLLTWFAPFVVGGGDGTLFRAPYICEPYYPEYVGYIGIAPLVLAALAPLLQRDRTTRFWSWAAVICLALALGRFWPFELYRLIYHVPILNLFRVPARHLMEVDFALAVLAGRAVTFLPRVRRVGLTVVLAVAAVLLTWATVTVLRPAAFRLGRVGSVSIMGAPELFMPLVTAAASACLLIRFAQGRKHSGLLLVACIVCDLTLWGQFTDWRTHSPLRDHAIFRTPSVVKTLRHDQDPFRILTLDRPLADAVADTPVASVFDLMLQPDLYMLHRIENAAGYDGFGLARYSRLAGDMKLWGEFADIPRSLLASHELDLLNVRYLIAATQHAGAPQLVPAKTKLGDFLFYERDLGLPFLEGGKRIDFDTPPLETTRLALLTNLAYSTDLLDGASAGTITLRANDGRTFQFDLRVGIDSSEWAFDRPSVRETIRHSRARVATSAKAEGDFDAHGYVTSFALPEKVTIVGGSIEITAHAEAPNFALSVQRVSFLDDARNHAIALRSEWIAQAPKEPRPTRWRETKRIGNVVLYRNERALPRVWLASEARIVSDKEALKIIRSDTSWNPQQIVLLERAPQPPLGNAAQPGEARILRYEPNEVEIAARVASPAILVLSDNHYPGWRVDVDGQRAPLLRADYNLRGVQLPLGEHRVRFRYAPASFRIGALISAFTALGLVAWIFIGRNSGAEPRSSNQQTC